MRLGIMLPQFGDVASPEGIQAMACEAETMGYDSVWVGDRVLCPVAPRAPYPGSRDGALPRAMQRSLDPIATLTFAAAFTSRIALGTSVLNLPYYNPVLLARQLGSLDVLSRGRLRLGFGLGWSPDELEAVGVTMDERGPRAREALDVLRKIWADDLPEHHGVHYTLPKSVMRLRPVQRPHPPIYMAGYTPAALKRVAETCDGWNPAGIPIPAMKSMFDGIRAMAQAAGRDPTGLSLVVRANLAVTEEPLGPGRSPFTGSWTQIGDDIAATRAIGAHELAFDAQGLPGQEDVASQIMVARRLREMAG